LVSQTRQSVYSLIKGMSNPKMVVKLQFVHLDADNDIPAVWGIAVSWPNPPCVNYPF
jgi:hypothetical protein